ncbi:DL-endopeptidase inhibitor IseA family protein [Bacillota bacterium Meth-B3]
MKKLLSIVLILCLLLTGVAALAEQDGAQGQDEQGETDADEWLFEEDDAGDEDEGGVDLSEFDEIEGDEPLSEEDEVEDTLLGAMEVYSWFVLQPLDVDMEKPSVDGTRYQVLDERFNTMDALRSFVSGYFSDELTGELFAMNVYTEENGYLYTTASGRNIDEGIGETEFEVAEETADRIVYTVTVHYWDEATETEKFTYERRLIDGTWRFTVFPFFW